MREKQKSCFKNYVLLVGKYSFFGAKLILAILMLILAENQSKEEELVKNAGFFRYSAPSSQKG